MQSVIKAQSAGVLTGAVFSKCRHRKITDIAISTDNVKSVSRCASLCVRRCCAGFNVKRLIQRSYSCEVFGRVTESCEGTNIASQIGTNAFILGTV